LRQSIVCVLREVDFGGWRETNSTTLFLRIPKLFKQYKPFFFIELKSKLSQMINSKAKKLFFNLKKNAG